MVHSQIDEPEKVIAALQKELGLTEEEVALITESDGYQLKFKAVELWEKLMGVEIRGELE